jgi:hypothetical protein
VVLVVVVSAAVLVLSFPEPALHAARARAHTMRMGR